MTLDTAGGWAALTCAASYLFGFALLLTVLAPLGYGRAEIDGRAVVAFVQHKAWLLTLWNTVIYIVNALALAVLVAALGARAIAPCAPLLRGLGFAWVTLVLGAGMIANVTVERVLLLAPEDPDGAVALWQVLHAVELGLGGGNEIAGAVWIGAASLWGVAGRIARILGGAVGLSGLATLITPLGDSAGALFGLGAIAWFVVVGLRLLRARP